MYICMWPSDERIRTHGRCAIGKLTEEELRDIYAYTYMYTYMHV